MEEVVWDSIICINIFDIYENKILKKYAKTGWVSKKIIYFYSKKQG